MRINLQRNYKGRLNGYNLIPMGEYEADNPILCGLAQYLVDNGHAVIIDGVEQREPEHDVEEIVLSQSWKQLDRDAIIEHLERDGIDYNPRSRTETLRGLLENN